MAQCESACCEGTQTVKYACKHNVCQACDKQEKCDGCGAPLCGVCETRATYVCDVCRLVCMKCFKGGVQCDECCMNVCRDCYEKGHYKYRECLACGKVCCGDGEGNCARDGGFYPTDPDAMYCSKCRPASSTSDEDNDDRVESSSSSSEEEEEDESADRSDM